MKILITGGAGYAGLSVVQHLMEREEVSELVVYDNLSRSNYSFFVGKPWGGQKPCTFIQGDIMDTFALQKALEGVEVVVHMAAKVKTPFSDAEAHAYDQVNHWGTAQIALAIEEANIPRVIYLSSASVYGNTEIPVQEFTTPNPRTFYGISKYAGEKQMLRMKNEREVFVLRCANVYGFNPCMRIDAVINRFMFQAHYHNRISINGNGRQYRSFIHVDKVAQVVSRLVSADIQPGIYNLAEHNLTVAQIVSHIKELYPTLEVLSINHNMPLRSIQVKTPCKITERLPFGKKSIGEELSEFKEAFRF